MISITYKFAHHNDWRLGFNVSYDLHKFKYMPNCVTMIGDEIACWFQYVQRPFLFHALNKTIQTFRYPCISFRWNDNVSIKSFGRLYGMQIIKK